MKWEVMSQELTLICAHSGNSVFADVNAATAVMIGVQEQSRGNSSLFVASH